MFHPAYKIHQGILTIQWNYWGTEKYSQVSNKQGVVNKCGVGTFFHLCTDCTQGLFFHFFKRIEKRNKIVNPLMFSYSLKIGF